MVAGKVSLLSLHQRAFLFSTHHAHGGTFLPTLTKRIRDSCRICAVPSWPMRESEKERKIDREREREKQRKLRSNDRGPSPVHSAIVLQTLISEGPPTLGGAEMKEERDQGTPARKDRGPSPVDRFHITCYLPSFSTLSSVGSLHFLCVSSMSSLVILASVVTAACIHLTAPVRTHWL